MYTGKLGISEICGNLGILGLTILLFAYKRHIRGYTWPGDSLIRGLQINKIARKVEKNVVEGAFPMQGLLYTTGSFWTQLGGRLVKSLQFWEGAVWGGQGLSRPRSGSIDPESDPPLQTQRPITSQIVTPGGLEKPPNLRFSSRPPLRGDTPP